MRRQAPDMGEAARGARRVRAAAGHGRPRGRARGRAHRSRGCPSGSCRRCSASTRSAGRDSPGGELGGTIALTGPDVASFQGNVGARSGRRPHVRLDQGDRRSDPHKPAPAHRRPTRPTAARPGAAPQAQGDPARLRRQGAALQAHPPGSHATRDRTHLLKAWPALWTFAAVKGVQPTDNHAEPAPFSGAAPTGTPAHRVVAAPGRYNRARPAHEALRVGFGG